MATVSVIDIATRTGGGMRARVSVPAGGRGPGLVLLHERDDGDTVQALADRYAEEGYVCAVPDLPRRGGSGTAADRGAPHSADDIERALLDLDDTLAALRRHPAHLGKTAAVGYGPGGLLACLGAARLELDCAIAYDPAGLEHHLAALTALRCPLLLHLRDGDAPMSAAARAEILDAGAAQPHVTSHVYADCSQPFAHSARAAHDPPATALAHSRTIGLLRAVMGPIYDLSRLWERHTELEFVLRDVDRTMATMVAQPYVNHVPTMTGGVGHDHLKRFYKHHFVNANPPDTRLIPVSRTVGADRLVDEMVFCFTHTCEIPWMLPGIAPTGKYVEVPLVAIVKFRGDKLCHEHIYWDQASVLVQIGALDPAHLPVTGIASARKLLDPGLPSNELMGTWTDSEKAPL